MRRGPLDLYVVPADKSSPAQVLFANEYPKWPSSWSPDDKLLAFHQEHPETGYDIWIYSVEEGEAWAFRDEPFNEVFPDFSPDGQWLA